jgi:hypothetical protein
VDAVLVLMIQNGSVMIAHLDGEKEMQTRAQIQKLLDDIRTAYEVGYQKNDLKTEAEKWGQIQILEWILSN